MPKRGLDKASRDTGEVMGSPRYRLPDGAEIESQQGSTVTFRVTMPADDAGHIGRKCPSCKQLFRMHAGDYAALPDDQRLTCPYCGFSDTHSEFMTPQQLERAKAAAAGWAQQMVADKIGRALDDMARSINRSSSSSGMFRMSAPAGRAGSRAWAFKRSTWACGDCASGLVGTTLGAVLAFGLAALLYLVTEELLVEAHEVRENTVTTAMFFVGFLVLLMVDVLT